MNIMNKVTLRILQKNKTRTIVTIIGVILSTAMFTAVTTFISSLQNYVVSYMMVEEGDWHGVIHDVTAEDIGRLAEIEEVENLVFTRNGGYSYLEHTQNEYKPYLHILELEDKAFEHLPIQMIEGRLPENENELLISEHIITNGGVAYEIGDTITLEVGNRLLPDGTVIRENKNLILDQEEKPIETIEVNQSKSFTIVGICRRLSFTFEYYSAPGYTIITKIDQSNLGSQETIDVYLKAKNPKKIYDIIEKFTEENNYYDYSFNYEVLRYMGYSNENTFNSVLYSLAAILIALIMVGSVSLIYNSFAISVSERIKLFGLLSSTGATAKQRMNSVYFESLVIAAIGIPIGVFSGICGIGLTLYLLRKQLLDILFTDYSMALSLHVSTPSIIVAVLVALLTILISAYIPAKRSRKVSAMDAIRQTQDIKLNAKKLKTSKLSRKIFGLEGELALKNFKRNRRRYRSTVISLFISIVLFISASSFAMYLKDGVEDVYEDTNYDLSYYIGNGYTESEIEEVYQSLLDLDSIENGSKIKMIYGSTILEKEKINPDHFALMSEIGAVIDSTELETMVNLYIIDHETFLDYIAEVGLSKEEYLEGEAAGIIIDNQFFYHGEEGRYNNRKLFKDDENVDQVQFKYVTDKGVEKEIPLKVRVFSEKVPIGISDYSSNNCFKYLMDEKYLEEMLPEIQENDYYSYFYFASKDPMVGQEDMKEILMEAGWPTSNIYNVAELLQNNRNILLVVSVFTYGFIVLISLITIANVFNTISTNVNLRRREFAMLKSVGMTQRGFDKMVNYECIFYGLKSLLYGLPVSIGVTYLIYLSIDQGVESQFQLPINGILISVFSVFFVVFVSMMYSMSKIRKENILEALKNENL